MTSTRITSPRLGSQYDRGAYLRCLIKSRWNQTVNPQKYRSEAARLKRINSLESKFVALSNEHLRQTVADWKDSVQSGKTTIFDHVEEGFALLREATRRSIGMFHYDTQILTGLALVRGGIGEMATGEGKTLAVSLPAFVFCLAGKGVHAVTVNSYLAERDYEFSRPIFDFLGISIALLPEGGDTNEKQTAYDQEITYGVGYEFGFDYMRDQLAIMRHPTSGPGEALRLAILKKEKPEPEICQRGLHYAIIDEVDSVLIDEAGSPLLISEAASNHFSDEPFLVARDLALSLVEDEHFILDLQKRSIDLTRNGRREIFRDADRIPWNELRRPWETYTLNALRAEYLFLRDEQYVVEDNKVMIVDEFTGRRFEDRSWREGQHQAVEAKEEVDIRPENDSAASITRQRFYALYDSICGLTGTAAESAGEFWRFFKMPVTKIPLYNPSLRKIYPERIFKDHPSMDSAIIESIREFQLKGQPILVGTRTIRDSERLSAQLSEQGIEHSLLTAKQDAEEEQIVSAVGDSGKLLIATNMAGRGTHIGLSEAAMNAGGLHVIQVERNESARIDRQLVGRGARQGQPGSAQVFVSADDYIITTFAPDAHTQLKKARANQDGELSSRFKSLFDRIQGEVEKSRYEMRLRMAEHDAWQEDTKESLAN